MELFQKYAGETERYAEAAFVAFDQIQQEAIGRKIAFIRNFFAYLSIFETVEICRRIIEYGIMPQSKRLMYLKIKTY